MIVMANLIRDAKCTSENKLDAHILRFRELRQKHPNHMPGWLEQYETNKTMEIYEHCVKKARKWIDDEPPRRALHYRQVLRRTPHTRGGFPRINCSRPKRSKRRKPKNAELLPGRRTSHSFAHSSGDETETPECSPDRSKSVEPRLGKKAHWALAEASGEWEEPALTQPRRREGDEEIPSHAMQRFDEEAATQEYDGEQGTLEKENIRAIAPHENNQNVGHENAELTR